MTPSLSLHSTKLKLHIPTTLPSPFSLSFLSLPKITTESNKKWGPFWLSIPLSSHLVFCDSSYPICLKYGSHSNPIQQQTNASSEEGPRHDLGCQKCRQVRHGVCVFRCGKR
ncbi:hypothetical protein AAZX31_11G142600 [Glycine max]